jgi:hypothetical protein
MHSANSDRLQLRARRARPPGLPGWRVLASLWLRRSAALRPIVPGLMMFRLLFLAALLLVHSGVHAENKDRARLTFVRESDQSAGGLKTTMLTAGSDKYVAFGRYPARVGKYEVWSDVVTPDAMQAMLAASRLEMGEGAQRGGQDHPDDVRYRYARPRYSWTRLLTSCPANTARPATTSSNLNATPSVPATSAAPASQPK